LKSSLTTYTCNNRCIPLPCTGYANPTVPSFPQRHASRICRWVWVNTTFAEPRQRPPCVNRTLTACY